MTRHAESGAPERKPRPYVTARLVVGLLLATVVVVFAVENRQQVEMRLLVPVVTTPLWLALAVTVGIGIIIGLLATRSRR